MLDDGYIPSDADMDYFVQRHFQRLIAALRRPESGYSTWLADALAFLVDHIEYFPPENTYFDSHLYGEIIEWMRRPDSPQPPWLVDALEFLVKHVKHFPPVGDEDAYVVEYVYPH